MITIKVSPTTFKKDYVDTNFIWKSIVKSNSKINGK